MSKKEQYQQICNHNDLPLQMQPWWLDIVCGPDNWGVCLAFDKQGNVVGALPYFVLSGYGVRRITMPTLTDYIGPWIQLPNEKKLKRISEYNITSSILKDLISQLPETEWLYQTYYPNLENGLPFLWKNYNVTPYYTYKIEDSIDPEEVFENVKYTVRTEIRKAEKQTRIETTNDLDLFLKVNQASFKRKKTSNPLDYAIIEQLDKALEKRKARKIYLARGIDDIEVHAGLYLAWDKETAYVLMTGIDPDLKKSGALYGLYWQAINDASQLGLSLDFCGSILPGIESSLRSFGGRRVPYLCVSRAKNKFWTIMSVLLNKAYH